MSSFSNALLAERLKLRGSNIVPVSFVAFSIAPLMGAAFMMVLGSDNEATQSGMMAAKAEAMHFTRDMASYFGLLAQAMGVGGILVFGFVASWVFGREYSDGTAKDMLALPTSRTTILNAKFMIYACWCLALALWVLVLGAALALLLGLPLPDPSTYAELLTTYGVTAALTIPLGTPIAVFALWGRGYLAPLGAVALMLVLAQVIAAAGYGSWFPWSVPGIYSGSAGSYRLLLDGWSLVSVVGASVVGYLATVAYWNLADQSK